MSVPNLLRESGLGERLHFEVKTHPTWDWLKLLHYLLLENSSEKEEELNEGEAEMPLYTLLQPCVLNLLVEFSIFNHFCTATKEWEASKLAVVVSRRTSLLLIMHQQLRLPDSCIHCA